MPHARIAVILILLTAAIALAIRLPFLDRRPMHGDEANQGVKAGILLEEGTYRYDPHDHHGPTLYYLTLLPAWIRGQDTLAELDEKTLRIVPVLFGAGLVLMLLLFRRVVGSGETVAAATLLAVSPAFVFYSRYFIQEMLLVFFTAGFLAAVCAYLARPRVAWMIAAGIFAGLMHATKETAILSFSALAIAIIVAWWLEGDRNLGKLATRRTWTHLAAGIAAMAVVSITLYSSFFTYARGPLDSILTYGNYLQRADGAGLHDKPWYYYLRLLAYTHRGPGPHWSEGGVLLLGMLGLVVSLRGASRDGRNRFLLRLLAIYTLALTVLYAVIPYKTPWSLLSFYFGWIVFAGIGACAMVRFAPRKPAKVVAGLMLGLVVAHLAYQSWLGNVKLPADPRNPYVYAHTSSAHLRLVEQISDLAAVHPDGKSLRIFVIQPDRDYWPIPWYLRGFDQVGYFDAIPEAPDADILIVAPREYEALAERLDDPYMGIVGGLRPSVLRTVLIKQPLWDAYIETRR